MVLIFFFKQNYKCLKLFMVYKIFNFSIIVIRRLHFRLKLLLNTLIQKQDNNIIKIINYEQLKLLKNVQLINIFN